jgi:16S rRNA (cytosine967-C5)-methyltransferase
MIAPARIAALDILTAVSSGRFDLPAAIARSRSALEDDRDRALAAEIATGVQRQRAALDHLIVHFAKRPIDRLDPEILDILRLSIYQLLHLSRVPASAVVNDAVNLTKRSGKRSAAGFVNGLLRNVSRRRAALPLPPRPIDPADRTAVLDYLSVTLSHPRWLAARWLERLGFEVTEQWMLFNNTAAPLTLRVNRLLHAPDDARSWLAQQGIELTPGRFAPDALIVAEGRPLGRPDVGTGWFVVQDEASQLVPLLAGPSPGRLVLDACASPGGKTTALACAMEPGGRIVACDVRSRRIDLLRRTIDDTRALNVSIVQADLRVPLPFRAPFDCVMVDAPCSGLGTLRRDPDIRWRRHEAELESFAADEIGMLLNAGAAVAPGGRLVYATCSSEPEENERVVETFLRLSPEFEPVDASAVHPRLTPSLIDRSGHLRTSPHAHGLEAFFGAVLERGAVEAGAIHKG